MNKKLINYSYSHCAALISSTGGICVNLGVWKSIVQCTMHSESEFKDVEV